MKRGLFIDGRIVVNYMFMKWSLRLQTGYSWLSMEPSGRLSNTVVGVWVLLKAGLTGSAK
jgi:hypothetical protein